MSRVHVLRSACKRCADISAQMCVCALLSLHANNASRPRTFQSMCARVFVETLCPRVHIRIPICLRIRCRAISAERPIHSVARLSRYRHQYTLLTSRLDVYMCVCCLRFLTRISDVSRACRFVGWQGGNTGRRTPLFGQVNGACERARARALVHHTRACVFVCRATTDSPNICSSVVRVVCVSTDYCGM